jgi:hypothetical protein
MEACEIIIDISKLPDIDPERKLWINVLNRAVKDYFMEDVDDLNAEAYKRSASAWIESEGLGFVCTMAQLEARLIKRLIYG